MATRLARRAGAHPQPGCGRRIPSLFGLAPCGVYPAAAFTGGAVRSYRTFSPLPRAAKPAAVCFLWHWPSLRLEAQSPDVIRHTALRSSDFPPPPRLGRIGSDRPARLHILHGRTLRSSHARRRSLAGDKDAALPGQSYAGNDHPNPKDCHAVPPSYGLRTQARRMATIREAAPQDRARRGLFFSRRTKSSAKRTQRKRIAATDSGAWSPKPQKHGGSPVRIPALLIRQELVWNAQRARCGTAT